MRIVHVELGRHLYGGALQVAYLLKGLQQKGHDSILVTPQDSALARELQGHLPVYGGSWAGEADPRLPLRLWWWLLRWQPHLLHIHSRRGADYWGGALGRACGIPTLVTRRVDNPEAKSRARAKYGLYDRVVAISHGIQTQLLELGLPPAKVRVIPSAVDTQVWQPTASPFALQQAFALPAEARPIGVVAQLIPRKGQQLLLQILPALLQQHPHVHLLLFGQGPQKPQLQRQAQELGVARQVTFAGFRQDLPRLLPALELLVHPATMEGLGVCLLQAAACEVPVVASRVGGIPDIVQHQHNGLLVEPGDPQQLLQAVAQLLSRPQHARQLAWQARQDVAAAFSIPAMVTAYAQLYEELLASG